MKRPYYTSPVVLFFVIALSSPAQAGYTHYFTWHQKPSPDRLRACIADMRKVVEAGRKLLAGPDGTGNPELTDQGIVLNGRGPEAHEPFVFPGAQGFNFCKTALKGYDAVVGACLIVARDHFPPEVLVIDSDGDWDGEEWAEGKALYWHTFGRTPQNPMRSEAISQPFPWVGAILAVVLVAVATWMVFKVRSTFVITADSRGVRFSGKFPEAFHARVTEFLQNEFEPARRFTIYGDQNRRGQVRLCFGGTLSRGEQQRVRNFLKMLLH
jgi:hypothetical protein